MTVLPEVTVRLRGLPPVLVQVPFAIGLAVAGKDVGDELNRLLDLDHPTPLGLAYLNVTLACAIPITWGINRVLHGLAGWRSPVPIQR